MRTCDVDGHDRADHWLPYIMEAVARRSHNEELDSGGYCCFDCWLVRGGLHTGPLHQRVQPTPDAQGKLLASTKRSGVRSDKNTGSVSTVCPPAAGENRGARGLRPL